jgi:hypothetical protein
MATPDPAPRGNRGPWRTTAGAAARKDEDERLDATRIADAGAPNADDDSTAGRVGHRGGEHPGVPPGTRRPEDLTGGPP